MGFTDTLGLDLDATLAEGTSPALAKLRPLRIGPAISCCGAAQGSALARGHLPWSVKMEAARFKCLCEGSPSRGTEHHIQLAGNGSSKLV
jgi:hypothetical protein